MESEEQTHNVAAAPKAPRDKKAPTSLVVTHIPTDASKKDILEFFSEIGQVRNCHLVRDKEWNFKGMVYIQYNYSADAAKALSTLNRKNFQGSRLIMKFSRNKEKENRKTKEKKKKEERLKTMQDEHFGEAWEERQKRKKAKNKLKYEANKAAKKLRKGRVILRNLPFKITEELIKEHFSTYGTINEVNLVRKADNKLAGYAFLQYSTRQEALRAIKECNMKPILGRPVVVDMAVPKDFFKSQTVKQEDLQDDVKVEKVEIKEESCGEGVSNDISPMKVDYSSIKVKEEKVSDEEESDSGLEDGEDEQESSEESSDDEDDDDDEDSESDDEEEKRPKKKPGQKPESKTEPSKDITEERTVFIKNLSFDASQEDISEVLSHFGELKYVLVCIDPLTEHPRGTAFAQFMKKESAVACLAAVEDPSQKDQFFLMGRQMHIMKAVSRNSLQEQKKEESEKKGKDKRNLYLAREGFIRPGTEAAIGVSPADMQLRQMRERVKRRMLQNLNIFFSRTRLCINNLPLELTDSGLRKIFLKHSDPDCKITEVRVMKNLREIGNDGKPKSRGYAFVNYTEHKHALGALRKLNNNPNIFTEAKRPVVEFSLENREIIQAREKRLQKSKEKNPLSNKSKEGNKDDDHEYSKGSDAASEEKTSFMGAKSDPTTSSQNALTARIGEKVRTKRGKITRNLLKKQRQDKKKGKKRLRVFDKTTDEPSEKRTKLDETSSPKKKNKKKKKKPLPKNLRADLVKEKSFNAMVKQYKEKMASANAVSSKRWYED